MFRKSGVWNIFGESCWGYETYGRTPEGGTKHGDVPPKGVRNIRTYPRRGYETFSSVAEKCTRPAMQGKKWTPPYFSLHESCRGGGRIIIAIATRVKGTRLNMFEMQYYNFLSVFWPYLNNFNRVNKLGMSCFSVILRIFVCGPQMVSRTT